MAGCGSGRFRMYRHQLSCHAVVAMTMLVQDMSHAVTYLPFNDSNE